MNGVHFRQSGVISGVGSLLLRSADGVDWYDDGRTYLARLVPWGTPGMPNGRRWREVLRRGAVDCGERPPVTLLHPEDGGGWPCGETLALADGALTLDAVLRFDDSVYEGAEVLRALRAGKMLPISIGYENRRGDWIHHDGPPEIVERHRVRLTEIAIVPRGMWPEAYVVGRLVRQPTNREHARAFVKGLPELAGTR